MRSEQEVVVDDLIEEAEHLDQEVEEEQYQEEHLQHLVSPDPCMTSLPPSELSSTLKLT